MSNENTRGKISRLRKDVIEVPARFDTAIDESSKVASRLGERREEVCTFIERIQAYEMILLKGTGEMRLIRDFSFNVRLRLFSFNSTY